MTSGFDVINERYMPPTFLYNYRAISYFTILLKFVGSLAEFYMEIYLEQTSMTFVMIYPAFGTIPKISPSAHPQHP
jgi:hypothetical protein